VRPSVVHAVAVTIACTMSYTLSTGLLASLGVDHENDLLGGMWAVIATVFVFRPDHRDSLQAARNRIVATGVSFVLCLAWLLVLPAGPPGLVLLIGLGTALLLVGGRSDDVVTTGVTTAVVMVVADLGPPGEAWVQPLLRALDTALGVGVGVAAGWLAWWTPGVRRSRHHGQVPKRFVLAPGDRQQWGSGH
jgi:uncharacterized membrane protein YccC